MITGDMAHVLLDAVDELNRNIEAGRTPWTEYEGGDDDPKLNPDGYAELIAAVRIELGEIIQAAP